jgi:ABC-type multidrug transport system fused ATPase/permease subunit
VVALVGRSGAGKSTIAQLVPRLYDPDSGTVCVDGTDLRRFTLESLRSQVSLVLQDTVLLTGTIAENIGYGIDGATREQIEQAARSANAHEFIRGLPDGYETEVGERGSTLSGGQRQRISIARAFIRQAPILVLDEPTTGLDADSTRLVVGALRSLMRGTSTIIISHDPSLVRCADRVLVVEDGGIPEAGTPAVLQRAGGRYADLMRRWSDDDDGAQVEDGPADGATVDQIIHRLQADGSPLLGTGRPHRHARHPDGRPPA